MSNLQVLKDYFGDDGYPAVENPELIALKKADPDAVRVLAEGITDGSLTY